MTRKGAGVTAGAAGTADGVGVTRARVAILGSTGSIGRQALEVCERFYDRFEVVALSAHANVELLAAQAERFRPHAVAIADGTAAARSPDTLAGARVYAGPDALVALATGEAADCDVVLNALVGVAGLEATLGALRTGKRLALANKESLVVGGQLVVEAVGTRGSELVPVDSEHSAVFQCLMGEDVARVSRIILTASGGPFRGRSREELANVTKEQALAHPRWSMGPKISVDSATLMNKGLEVIEAHHLFGLDYGKIEVVLHPQSIVHSMVDFVDGSVKAHLGQTDMRIPIQFALTYPERLPGPLAALDLVEVAALTFERPDRHTFRALDLAYAAGRAGGTAPAVLNGANEAAVAAFLEGRCAFSDIVDSVEDALMTHDVGTADSVEALLAADAWAGQHVRRRIEWRS